MTVALVVGAGRGLGRGCAERLTRDGIAVVAVSRTQSELDDLVDVGGAAAGFCADVTIEDEVGEAVRFAESMGDLRLCVNAAGTNRPGPAEEYATSNWDALFAVNVRATFLTCRAVGASMLRRKVPGAIVNMSSQMGHVGYPGRTAYCATKHAVEGYSKALAVEWAPRGIRVNCVAPTFVETPLTRPMLADPGFRDEVLGRLPTRALATVDQVANAVAYLLSDAAGSVTGHSLLVDGGWTAW